MKKVSILYYAAAIVAALYLIKLAIGAPAFNAMAPHAVWLFYVVFLVILLLLTHFTPAEMYQAIMATRRNRDNTKAELKNAYLFFKTAQSFFVVSSLIGIVLLVIWYLAGGFDTGNGPPRIASAASFLVTAFLYPLLFILFVCLPFRSAVQKKLNDMDE